MAITSYGYDGQIGEDIWAQMAPRIAAPYWVADSNQLVPTISTTADRTLNISAGTFGGAGVMDISDATTSIAFPAVNSGRRYDLVVARRNWQGTSGATSFVRIQGGAGRAVPNYQKTPGNIDDQPLFLVVVQAGMNRLEAVIDLRTFGTGAGVMKAYDKLALPRFDEFPGLQVQIGRRVFTKSAASGWIRTLLVGDDQNSMRVWYQQRDITFRPNQALRQIPSGWRVTAGDNNMNVTVLRDGQFQINESGIYCVTASVYADTEWTGVDGGLRVLCDGGLWGHPGGEVHRNVYPDGVSVDFSWTGYLRAGTKVPLKVAHYNRINRQMDFHAEVTFEMIG